MRWTQAIGLFVLLAVLTIQVEKSSAASLRNAVTEDEPLEIISDESDSEDIKKGLLEIRAREQVLRMRIEMRNEMVKFEKIGDKPNAKELAEKVLARLVSIRDAASNIADAFKSSIAGVQATGLVKQVNENIEKVRAKIEGLKNKPAQAAGNGAFGEEELYALTPEERVKREIESFRNYVRMIVEKIKKQGMAKGLGGRITANLVASQNGLKKIVEKNPGTVIGTLAQKAIEEAEVAKKVISEAIKKNDGQQKLAGEEDVPEDSDDTLVEKAKQKLKKIREAVKADVEKFEKSKAGAKAKEIAKRVRQRLAAHRTNAKKIAAELGKTEVGKAAKNLAKEIKEAMEKIRKSVQAPKDGAETARPQPDEDEEIFSNVVGRLEERITRLRELVRKEISKIGELNKRELERVKERLTRIRDEAKRIVEKAGETKLGSIAKDLLKQVEEAISKVRDRISGKPAQPTPPPKPAQPTPATPPAQPTPPPQPAW